MVKIQYGAIKLFFCYKSAIKKIAWPLIYILENTEEAYNQTLVESGNISNLLLPTYSLQPKKN
jgi:hypothetical protein